jgi:hypothetical protein
LSTALDSVDKALIEDFFPLLQAHLLLKYEAAKHALFHNVDLTKLAALCELTEVPKTFRFLCQTPRFLCGVVCVIAIGWVVMLAEQGARALCVDRGSAALCASSCAKGVEQTGRCTACCSVSETWMAGHLRMLAAQVKAGEVLCAEGGWPEWFNFVVSGVVVVDQRGRGEVARLTAGSYFGEVAFMKYEHTHTGLAKHASTFSSQSP